MRRHNANLLLFTTILLFVFFTFFCGESLAEITSGGVLDSVLTKYEESASKWGEAIQNAAFHLFWVLATISMVWTFAQLLFHRSSFAELFGELIRFIMFTGFYLWLLEKGPVMANSIIRSMRTLGEQASKQPGLSPSNIVDVGFKLFDVACQNLSVMSPIVSTGGLIITGLILIVLALVAINMLLQLCSAWVLAYAGIFFLGFGGCRWTSDMAINYFKAVLGVGASLMTMTLLVGVGTAIINEYHQKMTPGVELQELGILLVVSLTLLLLVDKLPAMVAGIITGASIGSAGVGTFGAGAAYGAGAVAMAATGAALSKTGTVASSGYSAMQKAMSDAGDARQQGSGAFGGLSGSLGTSATASLLSNPMKIATAYSTEISKSLFNQMKNKKS